MIITPTHLRVQPGRRIGSNSYQLTLSTNVGSSTNTLNKFIKWVDARGTYGWWPSFSGIGNVIGAAWDLLSSFGGKMDVVASFSDRIVISVNNPTFGYPYSVFVDLDKSDSAERYNYYVDESHTYTDSTGRDYLVTRLADSADKEFQIEAGA